MIPKIDTLTPNFDECFRKSDQTTFSEVHLFNRFLLKRKVQITTEICDFKLLLLIPRSLPSDHPKSQILVVFVIVFVHFFYPPEGAESNDDQKAHPREARY